MRSVSSPINGPAHRLADAKEGIIMTHAGTINLGGSAQSKQGGLWPAIALTLALLLAMVGAVWFASNAGLVGGTAAKPVAGGAAQSWNEYLNGVLDRAHATPYAGSAAQSWNEYLNGVLDRAHAAPYAGSAEQSWNEYLNGVLDRAHATPYAR